MKNKDSKFLTIKEFAEQKGMSLATVYRWIREGRLPGVSKEVKIPEEYLTLEIERKPLGRRPRPPKPPRPRLSREEKFERMKRIPFTLNELQEMFEEGKSFREIGDLAGVSWQAIAQIYKRYFESSMSPGWKRRKAIIKQKWERRAISHLDEVGKLSVIKEEAERNGYTVSSVPTVNNLGKWHKDRLLINGKLCRIFCAPTASLITAGPGRSNLYYRFNVARATPSKSDFIIVITREGPHQVFIFPSEVIAERFKGNKKPLKMFYIPIEYKEPYNNMLPKIDWWRYLGAWNLLEK